MGSKSGNGQLSELDNLLQLASTCDDAAAALGVNSKLLFDKVSELRAKNHGRGPGGAVVSNTLERVASRYFSGSNILRVRRGAHPAYSTFKAAVNSWLPALTARPVLREVSPTAADKAA